jgi:hypothetical protein
MQKNAAAFMLRTGMHNGNDGNGRLDVLKKREADIRAKIAQERVRQQKREEKQQERLRFILGSAALAHASRHPEFAAELRKILQAATLTDGEAKLLRETRWL